MATLHGADTAFPYPIIENDIDGDPTPKDQAIYVPSISAGYARDAIGRAGLRAIPDHLPKNLLNFLDQTNEVFRISHAMASAGQFMGRDVPSMITTRDRGKTRIIGDSGGYQLATGKLKIKDNGDRLRILRWLETNAEIAMTLDWPPGGIGREKFPYHSTEECLEATIQNLEFFCEHRQRDRGTIFLNVIQGMTPQESVDWYKAVKIFPFEGWAVAGALRNDIYHLCRLIILMHEDGELDGKHWFHVLGTSEPGTAVLLTALQRAVKQHLGHDIRFSFDTSTPFRLLAGNQALDLPVFSKDRLGIEQVDAPCGARFFGKRLGWPFSNLVDDGITTADMMVPCGYRNTTQRDPLGNHLLALQNLRALCFAIFSANRRFDVELITGRHTVGVNEGQAAAAIDRIMQASNKMNALHQHASWFHPNLRKSYDPTTADEDRDFDDGYDE
jgi:hypothetical protein